MKLKPDYLKSTVPALALSLFLLGGTAPAGPAPEAPSPFPAKPLIEEENPESNDEEEGIQPLSDLDEIKKTDKG